MGQAVPERNAKAEIVGYVGTITDITERKRNEAALEASERQLSLIYANISDVVFVLEIEPDDRFRFSRSIRRFLVATGLPEDQIVGKLVQEVIPQSAQALVLGKYTEAVRTRKAVRWDEVTVYPAGTKYAEVSATPILDADGKCTALLGTVHDITERKHAEEESRRRADEFASLYEIAQGDHGPAQSFRAAGGHHPPDGSPAQHLGCRDLPLRRRARRAGTGGRQRLRETARHAIQGGRRGIQRGRAHAPATDRGRLPGVGSPASRSCAALIYRAVAQVPLIFAMRSLAYWAWPRSAPTASSPPRIRG